MGIGDGLDAILERKAKQFSSLAIACTFGGVVALAIGLYGVIGEHWPVDNGLTRWGGVGVAAAAFCFWKARDIRRELARSRAARAERADKP